MNSAQALFSKVYEQAQGAAGAAGMNPEDFAQAAQDAANNSNAGFNKDDVVDTFTLPYFPKGNMYKGMETNKKYTLEELGL